VRYLAVAISGFILGGWAVPLGFVLGMGPVATFVSSAGGGLAGCWTFLLAGDRFGEWLRERRGSKDAGDPPDADDESDDVGRVHEYVDRYGVRGLGLVGPIFPGVTASVAGGLALGINRRELGRWMTFGIIVMYGLYVIGLWLLVDLF
jgi:hypothetical protein